MKKRTRRLLVIVGTVAGLGVAAYLVLRPKQGSTLTGILETAAGAASDLADAAGAAVDTGTGILSGAAGVLGAAWDAATGTVKGWFTSSGEDELSFQPAADDLADQLPPAA